MVEAYLSGDGASGEGVAINELPSVFEVPREELMVEDYVSVDGWSEDGLVGNELPPVLEVPLEELMVEEDVSIDGVMEGNLENAGNEVLVGEDVAIDGFLVIEKPDFKRLEAAIQNFENYSKLVIIYLIWSIILLVIKELKFALLSTEK